MATDPDYRANHQDSQKSWRKRNRDYWKKYRSRHPEYCKRNRHLQELRDRKRRYQNLAKMAASQQLSSITAGTYYLLPHLAKMDASAQKVVLIPAA
jgi:hypothetical protein